MEVGGPLSSGALASSSATWQGRRERRRPRASVEAGRTGTAVRSEHTGVVRPVVMYVLVRSCPVTIYIHSPPASAFSRFLNIYA